MAPSGPRIAATLLAAVLVLASCSDPPAPPECLDSDGDGFGDPEYGTDGCDDPTPDCNDGDHYVFPGADELCDGLDNDCDGAVPADEVDEDGDGIAICEGDCDDAASDAFPGAPELCDGVDNDCDGLVPDDEDDQDEDGQRVCEGDCDDDDESVHAGAEEGCDGVDTDCDGALGPDETDDDGDGVTECEGDCDDGNLDVYPGAEELCDGVDTDCDGTLPDEEVDGDGDGVSVCAGDCDDDAAATYPGAPEACDGFDNDCDDQVPYGELDADADGQMACAGDCDDADETVYPGASEICDGLDNDCDGSLPLDEADDDSDGYMLCENDCDDVEPTVHPGASELCDGLDNDCDGTLPAEEADADGDGVSLCEGDCDDNAPSTYLGATEICDGIDNDCDEALPFDEFDLDSDGWMECNGDCDDEDSASNPAMSELCDGIDNDCDGALPPDEVDLDGDGPTECEGDCDDSDATLNLDDIDADGYDTCSQDCDDNDDTSYPGAFELCDALDNDCDGDLPAEEADDDGDSYLICAGDCDDGDAAVHPGAEEICNGIDDDCDGSLPADESDDDGDGFAECEGDCADTDPDNYPGNTEDCDGRDNNCDGYADDGLPYCAPPIIGHIDGNGSPQCIEDVQGETLGIPDRAEAANRFQDGWVISGVRLSTVNSYEMAADGWAGPTFTQVDGLEFEDGGNDVQRTLNLPQALVAGAFILTLGNPAGDATAQTYILQGEQGEPGESPVSCVGVDCTLTGGTNLIVNGEVRGTTATFSDTGTFADLEVTGASTLSEVEIDYLTVHERYDLEVDCPSGYDVTGYSAAGGAICENLLTDDEVVQVGDFWIDRYEVSLWSDAGCAGTQYGVAIDDAENAGFDYNGNWSTPLYACSVVYEEPARWTTWFQAQQACELSGKSLCTDAQWQAAAAGTPDDATCNTDRGAVETTGYTPGCESAWGAMDMLGNAWEWVTGWHQAGIVDASFSEGHEYDGVWGADYGDDNTWNLNGRVNGASGFTDGLPAAVQRGGSWLTGTGGGVFSWSVRSAPSMSYRTYGARCCTQR